MAVPQIGTRLISYLGTTWIYTGPTPGNETTHRVRCVTPNPQGLSSYQTGSNLDVPESWFDRFAVVEPGGGAANGRSNRNR